MPLALSNCIPVIQFSEAAERTAEPVASKPITWLGPNGRTPDPRPWICGSTCRRLTWAIPISSVWTAAYLLCSRISPSPNEPSLRAEASFVGLASNSAAGLPSTERSQCGVVLARHQRILRNESLDRLGAVTPADEKTGGPQM